MDFKARFTAFNVILVGFALFVTLLLSFWVHKHVMPLKSQLIYKESEDSNSKIFFRDINHDGFSELYQIKNDSKREGLHYILFKEFNGTIIDQYNIRENINFKWVFFGDYTQDGSDDCFIFTLHKDSLFLYGYDIAQRREIIHRHYLMPAPYPQQFFNVPQATIYDLHNDGSLQLIFIVHAGLVAQPRGLYAFDFKTKKIVQKFENNSAKDRFIFYDLDGDGKDEIIVVTKATGNMPRGVPFTDWKDWLFILNQDFDLKYAPLSFGSYPSNVDLFPLQINNERKVMISYHYFAPQYANQPFGLIVINNKGHIQCEHKFNWPYSAFIKLIPQGEERYFYLLSKNDDGSVAKMDMNLKIIKKIKVHQKLNVFRALADINLDGKTDFVVDSYRSILIFDQALNLLLKVNKFGQISLRFCGNGRPPQLGINEGSYFYQFEISKNPFYAYLPLFPLIFFFLFLSLLYLAYQGWVRSYILINYFNYSINQTSEAIALLTPSGFILYFNKRLQEFFGFNVPLKKKMYFEKVFRDFVDICSCIKEGMASQAERKKDFVLNKGEKSLTGEVRLIPFKSRSRFSQVYAYLVVIKDFTKPVLTDRQQTWSRTVRKMAHDIKTPLGSVLLNIERIQQKIADSAPQALANTKEDFQMTVTEIKRIHEMTKNFLKFTNLEKPNLQAFYLHDILQNVLHHFTPYVGEDLQIELNLERQEHHLFADPKQLEMALQIFIENSIDALKGKGKILITSVLAQNLDKHFQDELEIEIADNGPGFSQEIKNNIFKPFFTTKIDGTGMGLAIAKKIIKDHGGQVEVITKENFGAVFRITLPAKRGEI